MTRKDFKLIADVLSHSYALQAHVDDDVRHSLAEEFADALATTNPRFQRERFIAACNGKGGR